MRLSRHLKNQYQPVTIKRQLPTGDVQTVGDNVLMLIDELRDVVRIPEEVDARPSALRYRADLMRGQSVVIEELDVIIEKPEHGGQRYNVVKVLDAFGTDVRQYELERRES